MNVHVVVSQWDMDTFLGLTVLRQPNVDTCLGMLQNLLNPTLLYYTTESVDSFNLHCVLFVMCQSLFHS